MVSCSPEYANRTMDNLVRKENKKIDIKYSLVVYLT